MKGDLDLLNIWKNYGYNIHISWKAAIHSTLQHRRNEFAILTGDKS